MNRVVPPDSEAPPSDFDRVVGLSRSVADARTLAAIQFPDVVALVAGYAGTPLGARRVHSLVPRAVVRDDPVARNAIIAEHDRVSAMRRMLATDEGWPGQPIPDLAAAIERLAVPGSVWTGQEFRELTILAASSRTQRAALTRCANADMDVGSLRAMHSMLCDDKPLEESLDRIVDEDGTVRDGASPELRRVRRQLRSAESDLVKLLEQLMSKIESHHRVDDASVTMRNGRWVIPVRREGRGAIGGIVHDTSASGATVFVEPPAAVEFANRIAELHATEHAEVERILTEWTESVRPKSSQFAACLDAMIELDSIAARARFADRFGCAPAVLVSPTDGITVVKGRHPLLLAQDPKRVVPFDLVLTPAERTLLVSGPNTGGKTVLLKAVALLSLMAQAGIPATAGPESALPLYDRVFADIGDEQSIEASLSTFSGHVKNLVEIMEHATPDSLVLVDELGSGTDPNEGAALGGAILEALTRRGTTSIATTHLGALKELAHQVPGVVNASLQFDEAALAPTYRLLKGIPGRSYGLSIARRLRMSPAILETAEARVPDADRSAAALIEDLEKRQRALDEREQEQTEHEESYAARKERIAEREAKIRTRERELDREGREAAKAYVLDARREIERVITSIRKADAGSVDQMAREARSVAERLLADIKQASATTEPEQETPEGLPEPSGSTRAVAVGDVVVVPTLGGAAARVLEVRGDELLVAMGSLKTAIPLRSAQRTTKTLVARDLAPALLDQPDIHAKHEIDLRGRRVHELDAEVQQALDDAIRADLASLRIVHGKATGALRERVGELLRADPRVRSFRLGSWNEGGAGVTVVEL